MTAGLAAATIGWITTPGTDGPHLTQMHTLPMADRDHVYFADDSLIVCLDRATGTTRWRRGLAPDSTFRLLSRIHGWSRRNEIWGETRLCDGGSALVATTLGWFVGPGKKTYATSPASIARIDRGTGATLLRRRVAGAPFVYGAFPWRDRTVVTGPKRVGVYDSLLVLRASFDPLPATDIASATSLDSLLVVATTGNVVALEPDSLNILWREAVGGRAPQVTAAHAPGALWIAGSRQLVWVPRAGDPAGHRVFPIAGHVLDSGADGVVLGEGRALRVVRLDTMRRRSPAP